MRESRIERRLASAVKTQGGLCLKFISPGWDGAPDRLTLLPRGRMAFVELKAPGRLCVPCSAGAGSSSSGWGSGCSS